MARARILATGRPLSASPIEGYQRWYSTHRCNVRSRAKEPCHSIAVSFIYGAPTFAALAPPRNPPHTRREGATSATVPTLASARAATGYRSAALATAPTLASARAAAVRYEGTALATAPTLASCQPDDGWMDGGPRCAICLVLVWLEAPSQSGRWMEGGPRCAICVDSVASPACGLDLDIPTLVFTGVRHAKSERVSE